MNRSEKKKAVAMGYDPDTNHAPRILASGEGTLAEKIRTQAELHNVKVVHDPDLANTLVEIPRGSEIPANLYHTVAGIYAMLKRIDERAKG